MARQNNTDAAKNTRRSSPIAKLSGGAAVGEATLVKQAYSTIEEWIATLKLAPGQVLSEQMLATLLGIGRTPVREALQQLSREGLVVILPQRGIIVSELDIHKQLKMLEVRREVERLLAGVAAKRAREEERARFIKLARDMNKVAKTNDGEAFLICDREFNQLLLVAARNEFATAVMKLMQGLSRRFWFAHYKQSANLPRAARLHANVARAIALGKSDEAEKAMDILLDDVQEFTRATLDSDRA